MPPTSSAHSANGIAAIGFVVLWSTGYLAGKLALAHICGEYYPAVRAHCESTGATWEEGERSVLGYHHVDVNVHLLQAWKFPPLFVRTAQYVLKPESAPAESSSPRRTA